MFKPEREYVYVSQTEVWDEPRDYERSSINLHMSQRVGESGSFEISSNITSIFLEGETYRRK